MPRIPAVVLSGADALALDDGALSPSAPDCCTRLDRKAVAKGHVILRAADNPNQIFLRVEYPSVEDAKTFRERLLASGVLDRFTPAFPPTVAELAEEVTY